MPENTFGNSRVLVEYKQDSKHLANIAKLRELHAWIIDFLKEHQDKRCENNSEIARLYANAMTEVEGACMWSIKAICK